MGFIIAASATVERSCWLKNFILHAHVEHDTETWYNKNVLHLLCATFLFHMSCIGRWIM